MGQPFFIENENGGVEQLRMAFVFSDTGYLLGFHDKTCYFYHFEASYVVHFISIETFGKCGE
jgi:hypothetical protein